MQYEGIVFDLDGTLVELNVDWAAARRETATVLRENGIDDRGQSLWELLERGQEEGFSAVFERGLTPHECEGARTSTALPATEQLPHPIPTGVCSLNCEEACRIALETHCLDEHVETVVGRDTVGSTKPDPEPLLETIDRLSVQPERTLFVGDTERDAITAERAGTAFMYVEDYLDAESPQ